MLDFINQYSVGVQAISSVCILIVTIAYSISTYYMYKEMKKQRLLYETPEIQIRLESISKTHFYYDLIIENISEVPVFDLKLKVDPNNFEYYTNKKLSETGYFNKPTKYFGVNTKYSICFIIINKIIKEYSSITIKAAYRDNKNIEYTREFHIDFSQFFESTEILRDDIHDVSETLTDLNNHFEKFIEIFKDYTEK